MILSRRSEGLKAVAKLACQPRLMRALAPVPAELSESAPRVERCYHPRSRGSSSDGLQRRGSGRIVCVEKLRNFFFCFFEDSESSGNHSRDLELLEAF